jgi:predicted DsbA family dithiol-disulfide isomerase
MAERVAFYFDPSCPWAWLTSRWLIEAARVRPIEIEWRFFSLAEVNRDREDDRAKEAHAQSQAALRVLALVRRRLGQAALARLFTALGEARHDRGEAFTAATLQAGLAAAGLDPKLETEAMADPVTEQEVLAEHRAIVEKAQAFGVPTLVLDAGEGPAIFGPVIRSVPRGEAAGELWDHVRWLMRQTDVYEIKRERTGHPDIGRLRAKVLQ